MGEVASRLWQLGHRELVTRLTASHKRILQDYAEYFALLSEVDSRGAAYELGYSNTSALLVHTQNISRGEANQRIAQAVALHDVKTPLDVAVPAYVVPAHIRRGLVLRDRGCAFPGCDRPASVCHSHHIKSWLRGGPTALGNLVLLCGQHHRLIHRSEWEVRLDGGVAWFTPPDYVDPVRTPRRNHLHSGNSNLVGAR